MGKYTRLKIKDRVIIEFLKNKNEKLVDIAVKLNRNKSTICREIKRLKDSYSFLSAQNDMEVNKLSRYKFKSEKYKEFTELFLKYYDKKYCGVETTLYLIKTKHKNVVSPCVSQTYN
ncbi:hypothetical protein FACS189459_7430 [Bacilli bacterium]|nr:hypothetical protein FACS189459_7430 [Bacilli bacterium]GHU51993.1 hypothetical protein FACS189496_1340 [Bacilli bacterium]